MHERSCRFSRPPALPAGGVGRPCAARGAVVPAVHAVRLVAEPAHEGVVRASDASDRPAALATGVENATLAATGPRPRRRPRSGRRGPPGPSAARSCPGGRGTSRVRVREQQRGATGLGRRHVQEVHGSAVDVGDVVRGRRSSAVPRRGSRTSRANVPPSRSGMSPIAASTWPQKRCIALAGRPNEPWSTPRRRGLIGTQCPSCGSLVLAVRQ